MSVVYVYPLTTVLEVHDGDTIRFDLDKGHGEHQTELWCRVQAFDGTNFTAINAPELKTPEGDSAAAFAAEVLPVGMKGCIVRSKHWDKYGGRYDGSIELPSGEDFGTLMLNTGHAVIAKY